VRTWDIQQGDCLDLLRALPDNCIDAIVTDPPYGLSPDGRCRTWDDVEDGRKGGGFMGKQWDAAVPGVTWARECLRVCKPGSWIVAFGGQRTIHRLICGLEDAGWMIRDLGAHQQWQGFPKSLAVGKAIDAHHGAEREPHMVPTKPGNLPEQAGPIALGATGMRDISQPATDDARKWSGFGTALKPCLEHWTLARKPLDGCSVAENVLKWGTGALNIDGCRYGYGERSGWPGPQGEPPRGRSGASRGSRIGISVANPDAWPASDLGRWPANVYACPKASRAEREAGLTRANMLCSCKPKGSTWESADQSQSTTSKKAASAGPDTTGSTVAGGSSWPTGGHGSKPTDQSPKGGTFTTPTETSSTTDPATCEQLTELPTSESTAGASFGAATGGSPALSVDASSPLAPPTGTSARKAGRSTVDAAPATSGSSSSQSACAVCGKRKKQATGADAVGRKEGSKGMQNPRAGAGRTADVVFNLHPT
jgi:hypothetical protein